MISALHGTVTHLTHTHLTLMTNAGVGYAVVPVGTLLASLKENEPAQISILTIVKEDSITLFGFGADDEKRLFEQFLSVSGVGPKAAAELLNLPVPQLVTAVEEGDIAFISRAKGVGKKSAQRLVVELSGKLVIEPQTAQQHMRLTQTMSDAVTALESLGYKKAHIAEVLADADQGASSEALIRLYLSHA